MGARESGAPFAGVRAGRPLGAQAREPREGPRAEGAGAEVFEVSRRVV